ncbi:23S rRNA (pseudouridine(1915)-N(3))-methyltransferase RlmH [Pararhodobacter marinus]|uniref:Ribosomal RNA large subunit methyltransferase H n=1 Tax=Pararhodobacter marinus TaxID=2184063 RepID=A0A2U2C6A1_9RHOB|nr:23S rRNA (pseudouridine(1915)-N(3))-methyltransferase RlmH [Pararhodobacter marinus]PWE27418.1 23S rRNA (pseudouridine(1915)-N(3))-methyltransferase RlmH [Pararhodobacter marinus]
MRLHICAMGRLRGGPERSLIDDYLKRLDRTGRPLGLGPTTEHQLDDRKGGGMEAEAALLDKACPAGAVRVMLDERGAVMSSPDFARKLERWRDTGAQDVAFFIGGADGLAPGLRDTGDAAVSFGAMVWPHALVRVMLAEQLYRAATILAGSPYHRV